LSSAWLDLLDGGEVRYCDAGGVRTRCLVAGQGTPMVLLHGRGAHAEKWLKNLLPLGASFRVHAIDLLGHGCTDGSPTGQYTIADFAAHVRDVLDALDIESAHVVGHTLGGWIGTWLAVDQPARVRSVSSILCAGLPDQAAPGERPTPPPEQAGSLFRATLEDESPELMRRRMERLFHDPATCSDELVAIRLALYRRPGVRDALRAMAEADNTPYLLTDDILRRVSQPALLIGAEHAHSTGRAALDRAASVMPRAAVHSVPGAAQWPQYEARADVHRVLLTLASGSFGSAG
jgi:pimeloyl-ACP methyl ester carboxylesterase